MLKKALSVILITALAIISIPFVGLPGVFAADWQSVLTYQTNAGSNSVIITGCNDIASGTLEIPSEIGGLPVTSIGLEAFSGCSLLTSISIPNSVTTISDYAFYYCSSLESILIPDSVTSIGLRAFRYCSSLTSITIGSGVTSIGKFAFDNTPYYNNTLNWEEEVLYIGNYLIKGNAAELSGDYLVKPGTLCIANNALLACTLLTSVFVPDSVVKIGEYAIGYTSSYGLQSGFMIYSLEDSAAEQYATTTGISCTPLEPLTLIENSFLSADSDLNNVISENTGLTASSLLSEFTNTGAKVYKNGAEITADDLVGTGCEIRLICPVGVYDSAYTVILGDIDGDCAVDAIDVFLCDKVVKNDSVLSGAYFIAANIDLADASLDINDYSAVLNLATGKS